MSNPAESSRQIFEHHPSFGRRFIPGIKARIPYGSGGYLIRVNQTGFRSDREFGPPRQAGMRRLLLFGDSFAAGDGVSNGKRFGDLLESMIPQLEVFNFGLTGTGTDQQYLAYQEMARGIDHDLLVLASNVDNVRRNGARFMQFLNEDGKPAVFPKPYFELQEGKLVLGGVPVPRGAVNEADLPPEHRGLINRGGRYYGLRAAVTAMGLKDIVQRLTRYQPLPEYDDPSDRAWLITRAIVEQWVRGHDRPVLLVPLPLHMYVEETSDPSGYQARFRELAAAAGCTVHDPLEELMAYPMAERRTFHLENDEHPTVAGHQALARSMAPVVEKMLGSA